MNTNQRRISLAALALCALVGSPTAWAAHDFSTGGLGAAPPAPVSLGEEEYAGYLPVMTNRPTAFAGADINAMLGADAFYSRGLTGSNASVANVEAGHVWNGHDVFGHVSNYTNDSAAFGTTTDDLVDRHATWAAALIGGRLGGAGQGEFQRGIAFDADLKSGAIATSWSSPAYALNFGFNTSSYVTPYSGYFGSVDVINSSWGGADPTGTGGFTILGDAFANQNPTTTWVVSAGNNGPGAGLVTFPGSGYNAITVGALENDGANAYETVADFSSGGLQDWAGGGLACGGCRAAVDLVAPGTNITAAFYGGLSGGNNAGLTGSVDTPGAALYSTSVAGTSFSSPLVAGAATLIADASHSDPTLSGNANSRDARVVKAVLMNSAAKIPGWDNAQAVGFDGAIDTFQSLDPFSGAGALDIGAAYGQYVEAGTRDVAGTTGGDLGSVSAVGWDFGVVGAGEQNLYTIVDEIPRGAEITATLTWFRERLETYQANGLIVDVGQADLDLIIREIDSGVVVARSLSGVNVVEHLHFAAPIAGRYAIEVDNFGDVFGVLGSEEYGLAWSIVVPEPATLVSLCAAFCAAAGQRARFSRG